MRRLFFLIGLVLLNGCGGTAGTDTSTAQNPEDVLPAGGVSDTPQEEVVQLDAKEALAAALSEAAEGNKRVLIHTGAPW